MKTYFTLSLLVPGVSFASSLTGDGYIYLTEPSTVWTAPANVTGVKRLMWHANKGALRFGDSDVISNAWNDGNIGDYSFAGGLDALASGDISFAFGQEAQAVGDSTVAVGIAAYADGQYSIAIGTASMASGENSAALFSGMALNNRSLALGPGTEASGSFSTAIGNGPGTFAAGDFSTAIAGAGAGGGLAVAVGFMSEANADYAVSFGSGARAQAFGSVALGMNTISKKMDGTSVSPGSPHVDDPVFIVSRAELGTYPGDTVSGNALTIYRNGAAHFDGLVRVRPSGDIPMGTYTAKPTGVQYP